MRVGGGWGGGAIQPTECVYGLPYQQCSRRTEVRPRALTLRSCSPFSPPPTTWHTHMSSARRARARVRTRGRRTHTSPTWPCPSQPIPWATPLPSCRPRGRPSQPPQARGGPLQAALPALRRPRPAPATKQRLQRRRQRCRAPGECTLAAVRRQPRRWGPGAWGAQPPAGGPPTPPARRPPTLAHAASPKRSAAVEHCRGQLAQAVWRSRRAQVVGSTAPRFAARCRGLLAQTRRPCWQPLRRHAAPPDRTPQERAPAKDTTQKHVGGERVGGPLKGGGAQGQREGAG